MNEPDSIVSRREFLNHCGGGLGSVALIDLWLRDQLLAAAVPAERRGGLHHRAKAKRVVQLFMNGGVSQCDTFDYKPALEKRHGETLDFGLKATATGTVGPLMRCPWKWRQHGECGRFVSAVLPHIADCVDDAAFLMAMTSSTNVHGPASYLQNTGFVLPGFPCMGAWVSYALGRLCDNLPAFVVIPDARGLPYNNGGNFISGFLPVEHQATIIRPAAAEPIADLFPPKSATYITEGSEKEGLELLDRLNRGHLQSHPGDSRLEARLSSYELAARMQLSVPELFDLSKESEATRRLYGLDDPATADFGKSCLIARRMLERGVRFVQVWSGMAGAKGNWDNHADIPTELVPIARSADQPSAALLKDLKARGMLEDTLLVWTTEFGRMPFTQNNTGRDHNGGTFVTWLAGAGIRGGVAHGESDEYSYRAGDGATDCHDLHATILHLLGIDHERLTFRNNGAERRLTDVHGRVIHEILA